MEYSFAIYFAFFYRQGCLFEILGKILQSIHLALFLYLFNNIYYNICSKSKMSSSRRLMLFTMHITRDDRRKHTQRNRSYQKRLDNCLQLTRKVTNKPVQQIPFN